MNKGFGFLVLAAIGVLPVTAFADEVVYSNNFSTAPGSEWSVASFDTTPADPTNGFLGQFGSGNDTTTLTLTGLDPYTTGTVTFDLYAIRSLDGNGQDGGGPDNFFVDSGATSIIATNFANYGGDDTQAYPNSIAPLGAGGNYASDTGATAVNTLGYTFNGVPMDAIFNLTGNFVSTGSTLSLVFDFDSNESLANESFGIDNITVSTNASPSTTPEPATFALVGGGIALLSLIRKYKHQTQA